jgi:hypothetical protein
MPYILGQDRTPAMKEAIKALVDEVKVKGDLNYVVCEIVGRLCMRDGGISYTSTSNWIDGVHGAERELSRRLLAPYEDLKKEQNSDVESFEKLLSIIK